MISDQWDVVRVPFPFTDKAASKKRPALALSKTAFNSASGHTIMAMITKLENNPWPADYEVRQWSQAGLRISSRIRMKFFTIENTLIVDKLGVLQPIDIAGFFTVAKAVMW